MNVKPRQSTGEFIACMAMMAATVAFSIDAMLPGLSVMAQELTPTAPDRIGLVITFFMAGMGLGTLFAGPLSDAMGRKPVLLIGTVIYVAGAAAAIFAQSLEALLVCRTIQGIGGAGPRIVAQATIRDKFAGREMARLVSLVMVVFTLVPVLAPTIGAGIIALTGWRGIFAAFVVFLLVVAGWVLIRVEETLPPESRRPFRLIMLREGLAEIWGIEMVRLSIYIQTLGFAMLYAILSATQLVFDKTFDRAHEFHLWFGAIALVAGSSGFLNAAVVRRFGMRAIIMVMFAVSTLACIATGMLWFFALPQPVLFWCFIAWQTILFFQAGMTIGNLNALAMEPVGHIAGLAASMVSAIATIGAALIAAPMGLAFNGTPQPLAFLLALCASVCFLLTLRMRQLERVVVAS
ncbi:multidrug effflux MFS transporter [Roseobacteraceae bacterium S113]